MRLTIKIVLVQRNCRFHAMERIPSIPLVFNFHSSYQKIQVFDVQRRVVSAKRVVILINNNDDEIYKDLFLSFPSTKKT